MDSYKKQTQGENPAHGVGVTVADHCETSALPQNSAAAATLQASQWDIPELMERLDGDEEFLRDLLVIFQGDARKTLEDCRETLAARNYPDLTRAAHTLKGMLKNLAMKSAAESAASLEDAARKESATELEGHFQQMEREVNELLPHVEARLGGVKS